MTMPCEKARSLSNTKDFLLKLLDPKETPRVPRSIRQYAARCLRHYPSDWDLRAIKEFILKDET